MVSGWLDATDVCLCNAVVREGSKVGMEQDPHDFFEPVNRRP